jgi:hypothetical protein
MPLDMLTSAQIAFLEALIPHPRGAIISGKEQVRILFTLGALRTPLRCVPTFPR